MPARRASFLTPRVRNGIYAAAILAATAALFAVDVSQPRGVVDGVGYSAVVALASRLGKRTMMVTAAVTSVLTVLAAALLPDSGISVAGMWANRAFALASIWIVALVLRGRQELEARIRERTGSQRRQEAALGRLVRECLLTDIGFDERLRLVCEISAEALGIDVIAIGLRNNDDRTSTILHTWRKDSKPTFGAPGVIGLEDSYHKGRLAREFVVGIEDVADSGLGEDMRRRIRAIGIRAIISAEIFMGLPRTGTLSFGREQRHRWSEDEFAYVRATASLVGLLISMQRNNETLAALELADDGIYTEDASGRVQYANRAARHLAGNLSGSEDYPRPVSPLSGSQDRHEIHRAGRDLEIYRARLPTGGQIVRLADVTERNQVFAERTRLEERLQQAAKLEAIGQLAGGMAHDFNNILGAVSGFAGFIAQDAATDSQNRDFAQRILSASKRGKTMVDQIMAFAETRTSTHGVANLGRAIRTSQDFMASSMHPGALLEVELPQAPLLVRGNEDQIGQLISNLVANGRDALDGGGGAIEVLAGVASDAEIAALQNFSSTAGERLVGEIKPEQKYARLSVSDSGKGIAPKVLDRIFEPFFSTKGRQRGTGLGLAVVHGVVRAHGGLCHVVSEAGKGTAFRVYLPLIEDAAVMTGQPISRPLNPCRVLIVDDEADMADMLSIGLERLGFQTVAVQNPLVALAAIEEDPSAFDTLLTDQLMPLMRGMELIREAKRVSPSLRAVLCTGHAESMSENEALDLGADAVIYKPVEIQTVAAVVSLPLVQNPAGNEV